MTDIRQFTLDFFRLFGAQLDQSQNNGVLVTLTPELAEHFGKPQLNLAFSTAEASVYHDLVVYGSRTFDAIMAYLEKTGEFARLLLPARHAADGKGLPGGVALYRCQAVAHHAREAARPVAVFNFHITYRADDKVEELYALALDAEGQPVETFEAMLQDAGPLEADSRFGAAKLDESLLPALAAEARKRVLFHADVRCAELEKDILPRLHKMLSRLVTYYEQQIAEIPDGRDPLQAEARRQELRDDLKRKIAEEVENHRLHVTDRLFSYAWLLIPAWRTELQLDNTRTALSVAIERDLYAGTLHVPRCYGCGQPAMAMGVCDGGHVACSACLATCHACGQDRCAACGVQPCTACGEFLCRACAVTCQACGGWACAEHSSRCPICKDVTCSACQGVCSVCGTAQCRVHLVLDHVSRELVCRACAITCPACEQPSAHTGACATCGQVFCQACMGTCYACGKLVCPGHSVKDDLTGDVACSACAATCSICQKRTVHAHPCTVCGVEACLNCLAVCKTCQQVACSTHRATCSTCGATHCLKHIAACSVCGRFVCSEHSLACPDCDDVVCEKHRARCVLCGQEYSARGINAQGLCVMCAGVENASIVAHMGREPLASDERVKPLLEGYTWRMASNRCYRVYLGQRTLGRALIVADSEWNVIDVRKVGMLGSLLGQKLSRK